MPVWLIVILIVAAVIGIYIWVSYNSLVNLDERVNEAWSDIDVQLKYRADLIPNVVETVKGYAKQEKDVIQSVSDARAKMVGARSVAAKAEADQSITGALSRIFALSESYPELKSNPNFQQLQLQLQDVEDKLQAARRFYNAGAKEINAKIKTFPINLFKGFGFKKRDYFEVAATEREKVEKAPEVKF